MTSSKPKPTIVLVHGAWHKPTHYAELVSALRDLGYELHVPALPSMKGDWPPTADLETDTRYLHDYVERLAQDGRQIVILLHSYGGQVGTNALARLCLSVETRTQQSLPASGGAVIHLIYMCALVLLEGRSMMGIFRDNCDEDLVPLFMETADVVRRFWNRESQGRDLSTPVGDQRNMVANMRAAGKEVQVFELDTGQCPHVTWLSEVVDVVDGIIRGL
ncbi:esterase/lipase family protein [Aspergillus melleus]|uniref:esterase/lipase family protein n=1 Tax=Aspergillus melleus TaxID=138277 RepID=UPI001E8CA644|nr:uncharacterized protein LDX57_001132 [Aspergillus melleus]KAH8423374.1 hypothetical protein LDX57_001132 [Aspergillus melleus]